MSYGTRDECTGFCVHPIASHSVVYTTSDATRINRLFHFGFQSIIPSWSTVGKFAGYKESGHWNKQT